MNLLHFALSTHTSGETYLGLCLADQLRDAGVRSHFAVSAAAEPLVRRHGYPCTVIDAAPGQPARDLVDDLVRRLRPDAFVLADYLNYWSNMERRLGLDPWFIEGYDRPVLPIDTAEWADTNFEVDICGWESGVPISRHIMDLPVHLRPVPVAHVDAGDGPGRPYRMTAPEPAVSAAERAQVRADLGLAAGDRLLLAPMSPWQQAGQSRAGMVNDMVDRLALGVPELLVYYLDRLPDSARVVVLGSPPPAFARLPRHRVVVHPPCPPDRYRALLASADALLLLSLAAVTGVRAVLMDVPVVMMTNRFTVTGAHEIERVAGEVGGMSDAVRGWLAGILPVAPFRQWPKGAYFVQERLVKGNGYLSAIAHRELLDEQGVHEALTGALYEPAARERLARDRAAYLRTVDALPPTVDVVTASLST
jgi:hypothetical protein